MHQPNIRKKKEKIQKAREGYRNLAEKKNQKKENMVLNPIQISQKMKNKS